MKKKGYYYPTLKNEMWMRIISNYIFLLKIVTKKIENYYFVSVTFQYK